MCLNRSVKRSGSSTLYVHYIHGEHSRSRGDSLSTWLQKYQRVLANSRPGRQNADKLVSYPGGGGGGGVVIHLIALSFRKRAMKEIGVGFFELIKSRVGRLASKLCFFCSPSRANFG